MKLVGLPGTTKDVDAYLLRGVSSAIRAIRRGGAATTAGDYGAINVWRDDEGMYCCQFQRFMSVINFSQFLFQKDIGPWLSRWLPQLNIQPPS